MAFTTSKNVAQSDNWKASGFLNLYLPSKDGTKRRKLGAIPLKDSKQNELTLREWVEVDPIGRCAIILAKLELEYQSAVPNEGSEFDLS